MDGEKLEETFGSRLFAPLTLAENWALRSKLSSGVDAMHEHPDYGLHTEVHEISHDLHVAWNRRFDAENPQS